MDIFMYCSRHIRDARAPMKRSFWLDLEKATPNIFAKYGFDFPRMAYIRSSTRRYAFCCAALKCTEHAHCRRKCFTWKQKERCYFLYVPESAQTGEAVPLVCIYRRLDVKYCIKGTTAHLLVHRSLTCTEGVAAPIPP